MSTNERELIAAKDLPVTEAEEVNVLVVDPTTGELAQKAGANLGGGAKPDMIVTIARGPESTGSLTKADIVVEGTIDSLFTLIRANKIPKVIVRYMTYLNYDYSGIMTEVNANVSWYSGEIHLRWLVDDYIIGFTIRGENEVIGGSYKKTSDPSYTYVYPS